MSMRLGIFTDSHYSSQEITCGNRYNSRSLSKIKKALEYFRTNGCERVVCLGDLIDRELSHEREIENLKAVARVFDECAVKISVLMGNHDAFAFETDEFYALLGEKYRPCDLFEAGRALLFLDACYFKSGRHYKPGDDDWTDTYFPYVDSLRDRLARVQGDAYIFLHQNLSPDIREDHRLYNDAILRAVLEESKVVRAVFEGHYHPGCDTFANGIRYRAFPAMCENECAYYTIDI